MSSPQLTGLPPIVGGSPVLLILGNAPSVQSLQAQQYYGNPRNGFWRIAGALFGFDPVTPYGDRVAALIAHGVAVWDVLRTFKRQGSLDSSVERNSMAANDFALFFGEHPGVNRVFFNGAAAESNYRRLVHIESKATFLRLPSTSPANTAPLSAKLAAWRAIR
jgi:hypoxanthine-DNA glycosylase